MSLMVQGIGPGDAVFTTPFTFIATAEVIQLLGATPVFVEIQKDVTDMENTVEDEISLEKNYPDQTKDKKKDE